MNLTSKKSLLIILAITAIVFSRIMFVFFNDPEGPNLLVTIGMGVFVYILSLGVYKFIHSISALQRLLLTILSQLVIVSVLYFILK